MKTSILISIFCIGTLISNFTSCKSIKITTQVAKFVSVEKLYQLQLNSSLIQVISILGCKPYNILSNRVDGYTIYTYKYKLVERQVDPKLINSRGGETIGTEVYNGREKTVFLFFKEDKLVTFVTTEGRKDSPKLIMLNNTLYTISKYRTKFIIAPASSGELKSGKSNPFSSKLKSKK